MENSEKKYKIANSLRSGYDEEQKASMSLLYFTPQRLFQGLWELSKGRVLLGRPGFDRWTKCQATFSG